MKKKIVRLASSILCIISLLTMFGITVNAETTARTSTYYMDGEKIYGTVTRYTKYGSGTTYCELSTAKKAVVVYFEYKTTSGQYVTTTAGSPTLTQNNATKLTRKTNTNPPSFKSSVKAYTDHYVQTRPGLLWSSYDCEDIPVA